MWPLFGMEAQGSAGASAAPFCNSSIEMLSGVSDEGHASVARRAVDRHAIVHQPPASLVDVVDLVGEVAEVAAAVIAALVPIVGQLDLAALITRHAKEDEREAARFIVHAPPLLEAQQLKECNSRVADRRRGSSNAGISFHLTQFIAINARFVAAVTGDHDRWLLVYADERTGFHPMIQKLQDSRAVLLGAVAIFAIGLTTSGYALGDGLRRSKMAEHRTSACAACRSATSPPISRPGRSISRTRAPTSVRSSNRSMRRRGRSEPFSGAPASGPDEISDSDVSVSREQPRDKDGQPVGPLRLTVKRSIQLRTSNVMRASRRLCRSIRAASRRSRSVGDECQLHVHRS